MSVTMIRGNQKVMIPEKNIDKFLSRGWQLEKPTKTSTTKKSPHSPIKKASAVVTPTTKPVDEPKVTDEEHDFLQQNQGFIDDNLNKKEDL